VEEAETRSEKCQVYFQFLENIFSNTFLVDEVTAKPDYLDDLGFGGLGTDYGASYGESSNYGDLYNFGDSYGTLFGDYADTYDADADAASDGGFGDFDGTTFAPLTVADGRPSEGDEGKGGRPSATDPPTFQKFKGAGDNFCNLCSGRDPADCMVNREGNGISQCPPDNVCAIEVRAHKGAYKSINIRCMEVNECNDAAD